MAAQEFQSGGETIGPEKAYCDAIDEMADLLIVDTEAPPSNPLHNPEAIAHQMRASLHQKMLEFREDFLKGYELLLKEMVYKHGSQGHMTESLPSNAIKI